MRLALLALVALPPASARGQTLTVFAASSLTETFEAIGASFEAQHSGVTVNLNFDGSATLALQILQGAPADVFASADLEQLHKVEEAGLVVGDPAVFARNRLVVLSVPEAGLASPADLARPGLLLVLAAPEVPAGRYARAALDALEAVYGPDFAERVLANLVSEETNVRRLVAQLELGEADAALVYATDAALVPDLVATELPEGYGEPARYPVAVLRGPQQDLAAAFVAFVLSEPAQRILAGRGFLSPE